MMVHRDELWFSAVERLGQKRVDKFNRLGETEHHDHKPKMQYVKPIKGRATGATGRSTAVFTLPDWVICRSFVQWQYLHTLKFYRVAGSWVDSGYHPDGAITTESWAIIQNPSPESTPAARLYTNLVQYTALQTARLLLSAIHAIYTHRCENAITSTQSRLRYAKAHFPLRKCGGGVD